MLKNIIVVAPEQFSDIARKLAHELSKKDVKTTFWTIKHYKDNEFQISSSQAVIFIGDVDENEFTKAYFSTVKNWNKSGGAFYGYDGNKAFIFGDGDKVSFKELYDDKTKNKLFNIFSRFTPFGFFLPEAIVAKDYFKHRWESKDRKMIQISSSLERFINDDFEKWISQ